MTRQSDFDFESPSQPNAGKIDYKSVMYRPASGDNIVRIFNLNEGKKALIHWVRRPKIQSIRCPGGKCSLCHDGFLLEPSYSVKLIDRSTASIKAWELNATTCSQFQKLISEFKQGHQDDGQKFTDQNLRVLRSSIDDKPQLDMFVADEITELQRTADNALIKADKVDLAEITKPWSEQRINDFRKGLC